MSDGRGTQPERTRLAWRRTVLTATVVGLLAVRLALLADDPGVRASGTALVMLLWLVVLAVSARRITAISRRTVPAPLTDAGATAAVTTATVVGLAALSLALLLA
ncbi:MAG: DUF202 domain-containing protein [Micromonosporaceae bacterium]